MDELASLINSISLEKNIEATDYFKFNEFTIELDNLEFEMIRKRALIDNILKWVNYNKSHSFPKRKKAWLNTFRTQKNLLKTNIKYKPENIIRNIKNKSTPKYLEKICQNVYKIIKNYKEDCLQKLFNKLRVWCSLNIESNPDELFNLLLSEEILIINEKTIILNKHLLSKSNKRKHIEVLYNDDNEPEESVISDLKKIKHQLS